MKIMTCNIRLSAADDGENSWAHRKEFCGQVIKAQAPDIICFQEMWTDQSAHMSSVLAEHEAYGMADELQGHNPVNSVFLRTDRFALISASGYWLSETPHIAGSRSWDSSCIRLANWVRLEEKSTGREFRVINTHLDHISQPARENQARTINADASAYPEDYPQILTGDMNCDCTNPAIDVFKAGGWRDTYGEVHGTEDPGHTFHTFRGPDFAGECGKMDWIFTRGSFGAKDAEVIRDTQDGRFPSDHYFVTAVID